MSDKRTNEELVELGKEAAAWLADGIPNEDPTRPYERVVELEHVDEQRVTIGCAWCGWSRSGRMGAMKEAARRHRESRHADRLPRRRASRS